MSFIQRLSKDQVRKKTTKKKPNTPFVSNVSVTEKDDKVAFILLGENLKEDEEYQWVVDFDGKVSKPNTIGTTLVLTKINTNKFKSSKVVTVTVKNVRCNKFIVKDDVTDNQESIKIDN